ncbi:MAG: hydantoinase/oxoprolinase family protein [Methylobacteriaceae bacterium]|nr:hydantoinase/oxoprolinase family protein [Methylobacteriaceae bacterium]
MRFAVDTGGTFTDLLVEDSAGRLKMYKAPTTPHDPVAGMLDALRMAATDAGRPLADFLREGDMLIHGTTHAINAILTGNTAKTAFLTTMGHPDTLVFREGGRNDVFNFAVAYPEPYVPRALTFEVPERVVADGTIRTPLDETALVAVIDRLRAEGVEAVAVCLLWSIVNPLHEQRIGALLAELLPGVPVTLSHRLNPSLREYRRASSACIDASLKPLMTRYIGGLSATLRREGFGGRVLMVTSQAGVIDATEVAERPVHLVNSGPSMAPVAGWLYAREASDREMAIVADTGGTTFDVSLVRRGRVPRTRETWIGPQFLGHMTGLPSVDVKSIGAGGGSIASVDAQGLLKVGPASAGAVPGPACYGLGGTKPTLTDAALVLGIIDPLFFLGGSMKLDIKAAAAAIERDVAKPLATSVPEAAHAIFALATENMVQAIMDITVNQGIDPNKAVLVGGGGAAGLNMVAIGRRLDVAAVVVPRVGAALSAAGALLSDLTDEYRTTCYMHTARFDRASANAVLASLEDRARAFIDRHGANARASAIEFHIEARYPDQVWEIEVPLRKPTFDHDLDVKTIETDFHATHQEVFAVCDPHSRIEIVGWSSRAACTLRAPGLPMLTTEAASARGETPATAPTRNVYFGATHGYIETKIVRLDAVSLDASFPGPAIVESAFATILIDPGTVGRLDKRGTLIVDLRGSGAEGGA